MTNIKDILLRIPEPYRSQVESYLPMLAAMTLDEIEAFIASLIDNGWEAAFAEHLGKLSTVEVSLKLSQINQSLLAQNQDSYDKSQVHKEFLRGLLSASLAIAKAAAGLI